VIGLESHSFSDFLHDYNPLKENVGFMGYNQEGKTESAIELVPRLRKAKYNVIICDTNWKFTKLDPMAVKRTLYDLKGEGLEIFQPHQWTEGLFEKLVWFVYTLKNRNVVFIVDELGNYVEKQSLPESLKIFVKNCNNHNIGFVAIFHSPAEIPNKVLRMLHHVFCYYMDLDYDIDVIRKNWFGDLAFAFREGKVPQYRCLYKKRHGRAVIW
jgi:hypothetical protein